VFVSEPLLNELRLGGFYHAIGNPERGTADVNLEILTRKVFVFEDPAWAWLSPRAHMGGTFNTGGGTSHGYAGHTWTWEDVMFKRVFAEFSFGGSVNDGYTGLYAPRDRAKLGCSTLFRESGSLGYRLTEHWSIMATIEHISNGGLCDENRGITSAGARIGYSF
jgi:lipid A 3-O-deacylase